MYRYIGNKTRVIEQLLSVLLPINGEKSTFADLMCGTASVGEALAASGHKVIAADILTFPTFHAITRLVLNREPDFNQLGFSYQEIISELNSLQPVKGFFWKEYSPEGSPENGSPSRMYFSAKNAMKIDAVSSKINEWNILGKINTQENSLLRHNLIMASNRVANIAGTYGHFRSSFSKQAETEIQLQRSEFNSFASTENIVIKGPAEKIAKDLKVDFLYLDPPYMKRQYAANYHILETLALGDAPNLVGKSGLRDWWPDYSDFCSKKKIESAFRSIFEDVHFKKAFISYSEDGLLSTDQLKQIFSDYGSVRIHQFDHTRFKSNKSVKKSKLKEYVFEIGE